MMLTGIKNSILDMGLFANKWGHCNKERSCFTASEMFSISNYRYLFISFPASFHIFSSKKKNKKSPFPQMFVRCHRAIPHPLPQPPLARTWPTASSLVFSGRRVSRCRVSGRWHNKKRRKKKLCMY